MSGIHWSVNVQSSGSHWAVQPVIGMSYVRQSQDSHQTVNRHAIMPSSGSHQAVIKQSSEGHQPSSDSHQTDEYFESLQFSIIFTKSML